MHGSFIAGIVMFAIVIQFLVRPRGTTEPLPAMAVNALVGFSLAASALSFFFLRNRVPRKNTDESANLYWTRASQSALIAWAPFEGAALAGLVAYMHNGSVAALVAAGIALLGLITFHPGRFERAM